MSNDKIKILFGYIAICLIWGSTWVAIRFGLNSLTPLISAGIRFLLAATLIFTIMRIKGISIQKDILSIKLYVLMGYMSFVIPFGLVYWAEQFISSGLASVLFGAFPFSVFIFSLLLLNSEEADKYKFISVFLGFIGIIIIFSESLNLNLENHLWGVIAVLVSAIMQGLVSVVIKKKGGYLNPFSMNALPLLIAGISMIVLSFIFEDTSSWIFDQTAILSITYLAIFGTIFAFTIYFWLLKRINAVILSLSSFITPIIAIILGWFLLNEKLTDHVLLGTVFVLIGILFGNFKDLKKIVFSAKGNV